MSKRVLFIRSNEIYLDSRATKEITALLDAGYTVSALGWSRGAVANETKQKCIEQFEKYGDKVSFNFYNANVDGGIGFKGIFKLLKWFKWCKKVIKKSAPFDYAHLCDLDSAFGVYKLLKKKKTKIVYDIFDYYIDCHYVPKIIRNFVENKEIKVINNANLTIICTEERYEQISKSKPQKYIVIHNSPDVEKIEAQKPEYDYAYFGALYPTKRLCKEIFEEYEANSQYKFAIGGYGSLNEQVIALDSKYQNFNYFGKVSYSEVLSLESKSKVISAIYEPTIRNHRLCAPNKFYEALALAKPVIVCRGTGIDKIVLENDIGVVIDYSAEDFYKALSQLCDDDNLREEMGKRARSLYEKDYRWSIMKQKLITAYQEI